MTNLEDNTSNEPDEWSRLSLEEEKLMKLNNEQWQQIAKGMICNIRGHVDSINMKIAVYHDFPIVIYGNCERCGGFYVRPASIDEEEIINAFCPKNQEERGWAMEYISMKGEIKRND